MTRARPSLPLSGSSSSPVDSERFLDACVLADRAALYRSVAREIGHVLGNLLQVMAVARADLAAGGSTWDRLDTVSRVLARLADDGRSIASAPVVVRDVLTEVDEWQRCQRELPDVPVRFDADPLLPPACGVESEIRHALLALITNAREAVAGRAGAEVQVTAAASGETIALTVTDNGPGVADGVRERIFEPFYTTKDPATHLGLGLTVVRHLMKRAGGNVRVDAAPGGKGTRAEIGLPIWKRT
jgi:two-component system C4-dicarboxylate transport sensor histidine kinase DctB